MCSPFDYIGILYHYLLEFLALYLVPVSCFVIIWFIKNIGIRECLQNKFCSEFCGEFLNLGWWKYSVRGFDGNLNTLCLIWEKNTLELSFHKEHLILSQKTLTTNRYVYRERFLKVLVVDDLPPKRFSRIEIKKLRKF